MLASKLLLRILLVAYRLFSWAQRVTLGLMIRVRLGRA